MRSAICETAARPSDLDPVARDRVREGYSASTGRTTPLPMGPWSPVLTMHCDGGPTVRTLSPSTITHCVRSRARRTRLPDQTGSVGRPAAGNRAPSPGSTRRARRNGSPRRLAANRNAAPSRSLRAGRVSALRRAQARGRAAGTGKRLFDLVVGSVLALVALPVIVASAIGISLSLRARPFFIQERVGRNGETFRVPKIRTLPLETPRYADKHQLRPYATSRFGALLRRRHVDELPQLLLVPLGRMSLVGPRPEMAHLYSRMPERQGGTRLRVRPGCTGLWQISVDHDNLIADAPHYDIFYVEHRTWRLDLWTMWRTALIMLGGREPITLSDIPSWAYPGGVVETVPSEAAIQVDRRRAPRAGRPEWLERVGATAVRTRGSEDGTAPSEAAS
jgi:lipopolysaccharide/colanic/teichoic acid biosynthesis glycosyltransferase